MQDYGKQFYSLLYEETQKEERLMGKILPSWEDLPDPIKEYYRKAAYTFLQKNLSMH